MDIWAAVLPRWSRMLYCELTDGSWVDARAVGIVMRVHRVVTTHCRSFPLTYIMDTHGSTCSTYETTPW